MLTICHRSLIVFDIVTKYSVLAWGPQAKLLQWNEEKAYSDHVAWYKLCDCEIAMISMFKLTDHDTVHGSWAEPALKSIYQV